MPIYEYRCSSCGQQQEVMQKLSDPLLTTCPKCGKPALVKMLTAAGFQLKGSGWYATDFKTKATSPSAGKETKEGGGDKKAADSGGEKQAADSGGEKKTADNGGGKKTADSGSDKKAADSAKAPAGTPGTGTT